jgi:hypothetical protein
MDPVPDLLLLRKSGSARNRTPYLWICSQELLPLDHRGGLPVPTSKQTTMCAPYYREVYNLQNNMTS